MFGVSGEFFHGIGFRHMGMPWMIALALPPPGPIRITSHFARGSAVFAKSAVLM